MMRRRGRHGGGGAQVAAPVAQLLEALAGGPAVEVTQAAELDEAQDAVCAGGEAGTPSRLRFILWLMCSAICSSASQQTSFGSGHLICVSVRSL